MQKASQEKNISRHSSSRSPPQRNSEWRETESQPCDDGEATAAFAIPRQALWSGQSPLPCGRRPEQCMEIFFSSPAAHREVLPSGTANGGKQNRNLAMTAKRPLLLRFPARRCGADSLRFPADVDLSSAWKYSSPPHSLFAYQTKRCPSFKPRTKGTCSVSSNCDCYSPIMYFSSSSSTILAAITPPDVFQIVSSTLNALLFLTTFRFFQSGSLVHSCSSLEPSPSPVS